MKIQLTPRHFHLTAPIVSFASEKLSHLDDLTRSVISASVVFTQHHSSQPAKKFTVKVRLAVPGKNVHAADTASDLYSAIDGVESKLARQLRKHKTRLTDSATRRLQRARERAKRFGGGR